MTRACPLPVDWLDYLDGDRGLELSQHLATCWSCQKLVESLQAGVAMDIPERWTDGIAQRTDAVWTEDRPATPSPAEFWFSASQFALGSYKRGAQTRFEYQDVDRVLVLVLSAPEDDQCFGWTDVVPVLSDVEAATETDLLFSAQENSLNAPWRALFAHQLKVARNQLDTRVGSLTAVGFAALSAALAEDADEARWGMALQHAYDPRGRLDDELGEALTRLRTPWLLIHSGDEDDDSGEGGGLLYLVGAGETGAADPDRDDPAQDDPGNPDNVFWLTAHHDPRETFAMAAASLSVKGPQLWEVKGKPLSLTGKLDMDYGKGMLVFVVIHADLRSASRLRLHVQAAGKRHVSQPFKPGEHSVPIARGVTSAAVEKVGAEVLP